MAIRFDRWGLAARLSVLSVLAVFLGTSLGGWVLRDRLQDALVRNFEAQLRDRMERLVVQMESAGVPATRTDRAAQGDFGRIFSGWYWVVSQGGHLQQSRSAWDSPLDPARAVDLHGDGRVWTLTDGVGRPLLGLRQSLVLDGVQSQIHVFGPLEETLTESARIDHVLIVTQLLVLLVLALTAVLVVRWGLAPLRRLQERMRQVQQGQATAVGGGFGRDLDPLAGSMDQVLTRNAQVVSRARHQAADLSHSLKKPLALMALEARKPTVQGVWVQEQVQALSHTIDRHLARVGSGAGLQQSVAVCAVVQRLLTVMQRLHLDQELQWSMDGGPPGLPEPVWRGNVEDLEEMLGNLLDNAGKWAASRVHVTVGLQHADDTRPAVVRLCVEDDGPGLSEDQLPHVARRGQRFDEAVAGHGLGLAIVRDLAEAHGGQLQLGRSPWGGLQCVLTLPQSVQGP